MKNLVLALSLAIGLVSMGYSQETTPDPNGPAMQFDSEVIDYGLIEHKSNGVREFKFTNTGKKPLIITGATGSCGCTVPTYPKEPIAPGQTGVISVKYATDRVGSFTKTVTLRSNDVNSPSKILTIKGEVKSPPPAEETMPLNKDGGMAPIEGN